MLKIYKKLFLKLHQEEVIYCIYKGLNHIAEDLEGKRGDLDILISSSFLEDFEYIVKNLGFNRIQTSVDFPRYYMSRDEDTGSFVMLDIDVDIRLGDKPNRPISFTPDIKVLSFSNIMIEGVPIVVLGDSDYLPLMLFSRITMQNPSDENLKEIKLLHERVNKEELKKSYFGILSNKINPKLLNLDEYSWSALQHTYKDEILDFFAGGAIKRKFKIQYINNYVRVKEVIRKLKRIFGQPAALAHNGYIVAFVGVDGSGKSSAIDCVLNDKYFAFTGLKRIYFGGNEFLIPGILALYQWLESVPSIRGLRVVPSVIMQLDRRIRLLKALYYKGMGNIVLCDRYYYDDELSREYIQKRISKGEGLNILNKLQLFFMPKVLVKPDLTLYLDVSPEVAYQRKQDFSFDTMLKVNKDYKKLMSQREEVTFINADEEQVKVQRSILKKIKNLSDTKK